MLNFFIYRAVSRRFVPIVLPTLRQPETQLNQFQRLNTG
jgi:hypothetical protein